MGALACLAVKVMTGKLLTNSPPTQPLMRMRMMPTRIISMMLMIMIAIMMVMIIMMMVIGAQFYVFCKSLYLKNL